jgi:tetratricopeptide (TPR) repeat protein
MFGFEHHFQTYSLQANVRRTDPWCRPTATIVAFLTFAAVLFAGFAGPTDAIAAVQDDAAAYQVAEVATNAQNNGDFKAAVTSWQKLLAEHPDSIQAKKIAQLNLGVCLLELQQFEGAIDAFNKAIPQLTTDQSPRLAEAQLSLGFCLLRHGQALAKLDDDKSKEESSIELTTATQAFERVLVSHEGYADADQAAYFQGQAYRELERYEDAAKSYEKMRTFDKQYFKFNGMYFLADVYERLGRYDEAIELYKDFREQSKTATGTDKEAATARLNDANFAYAETLMNLAAVQRKRDEPDAAELSYETADEILDEVNAVEDYELRDRAIFKQAICAEMLGENFRAASLYEQVAEMDSDMRDRATVFAGRNYLVDEKPVEGVRLLQKSIESDSSFSIDGVHLLASHLIKNNESKAAFELVEKWIEKSKNHPLEVELLMDRADASWGEEKLRDRSAKLYREIFESHPDHPLAPQALYAAAFALKSSYEYDESIKLADLFIEKYSDDDYLPDALGVKAESLLLSRSYPDAEAAYRKLAREFSDNNSIPLWIVNAGNASYLQGNDQPTIEWLESNMASVKAPKLQAEAFHLIGSSQLRLKQFADAITNLNKAISADAKWPRAAETLGNLSRAELESGDLDKALATVKSMAEKFPESASTAEAHYYVAEAAYKTSATKIAIENYDAIINNFPESELVPAALAGAGWSALKGADNQLANQRFTELIEKYPDNELVANAKSGRGVAQRNDGNVGESIADLKASMDAATSEEQSTNIQYELGLAYVQSENWDEAIKTFDELIEKAPDSPLAEKFYYELAWAYHAKKETAKELELFGTLVEKFPSSEFAPEANFFLGTDSYDKKEYQAAIDFFSKSNVANASDEVREKAAYKIGWAHYHLKQFDEALASFQTQTDAYKEGELYADGLFMVGQSHFGKKNYDEALKAYTVAKPVIETSVTVSDSIKKVMLLNAAQAANATKSFDTALSMATPLTTMESADETLKQDAWLEVGIANGGKRNYDDAIQAYNKAAGQYGKTGAQAKCLRGDIIFKQASDAAKAGNAEESKKKFDEAIESYNQVFYGHGFPNATKAVRPWQAYAAYEAAQCNVSQVNNAPEGERSRLLDEGIKHLEFLLKNFPDDRLVEEAKKQLDKLKQLKQ